MAESLCHARVVQLVAIVGVAYVQLAASLAQTGIVAGAKHGEKSGPAVEVTGYGQNQETAMNSPPLLPPLIPAPAPAPEDLLHRPPTSPASCRDGSDTCSWRQVVPGHMALPGMMEQKQNTTQLKTSAPAKPFDQNCTLVFEIARDIVTDFMEELRTADPNDPDIQNVTGWVWQLQQLILVQNQSNNTADLMDDVLNRIGLSTGTRDGHIWTQTDNAMWAQCNSGGGNEEDDSLGTCQGDEYCTDGHILLQGKNISMRSFLALAARKNWKWSYNIWPESNGAHEIPYCYDLGVTQLAKDAVRAAMDHLEEQVPCIRFKAISGSPQSGSNPFLRGVGVQRNCPEFPSVLITSQLAGCASPVGAVSGTTGFEQSSQIINMGANCESLGIAVHELLHTLGLLHEMSRTDRDAYVTVEEENIMNGVEGNFKTEDSPIWKGEVFDFNSIMMYGSWAFTVNGEQTIVPNGDIRLSSWLGQRMGLSEMDVEKVGTLYGCLDQISPTTRNKNLSLAYTKGEGLDGHFDGGQCKDTDNTGFYDNENNHMTCNDLQIHCNHETLGSRVRQMCPVACFICIPGLGGTPSPMGGGGGAGGGTSSDHASDAVGYSQPHRRRRSSHAHPSARPGLWRYVLMALLTYAALLDADLRVRSA